MSWKDKLNNTVFEITTGDGNSYFPKWKNATKELEFNISQFDFVEVDGSLIIRKSSKGRIFPLEFYFDGDNAIDIGNAFELSSRNVNRWTITHPFYGIIKCQPIRLKQDNTRYNVSKFNVEVIETLTEGYPKPIEVPEDVIITKNDDTNNLQAAAFENNGEFDRNELASITEQQAATFENVIDDANELNEFKALVDDALNTITNVNSSALSVIRSIQAYINYPARVTQTVKARYNSFKENLDKLLTSINNIDANIRSLSDKNQFEAIAGALISASQLASTTNLDDDYKTREDVVLQQENLVEDFNNYITVLDENQTERADTPESYTPNFDALNSLNELFSLTVSNLFSIIFETQQTRIYINDKDSNAVILTHKFYGLDADDENLQNFININNIRLNEILAIKKGREIIYYI